MACILKLPGKSKGVVTFTSEEQRNNVQGLPGFTKLKSDWLIGLHHNWQIEPHEFSFDFSMGRREGIYPQGCPLIEIDASCFATPEFYPGPYKNKHWDILHIARAVTHRELHLFLDVIRKLYDRGHKYRVLLIAAIVPNGEGNPKDLLGMYDSMFSFEEKQRFNLIEINYNYPFPWDYKTLAHYYRQAKVFLNAQTNGLPCRISVQAVASGLPFVTYPWRIPLVPEHLQKSPAHYIGRNQIELADKVVEAVESYTPETGADETLLACATHFEYSRVVHKLKGDLKRLMNARGEEFVDENFNLLHLDYRIARHHGMSVGSNKVDMSLERFIDVLLNERDSIDISKDDLENSLCLN